MKCREFLKKLFIKVIELYQIVLSPIFGNQCRFYPSCSEYSKISIERYGVCIGILRTIYRLFRCNPLCTGGVDIP